MSSSGSVCILTDSSFDSEVKSFDKPVLVDFWASWCSPCKAIAPHLEDIAKEMTGKAKVAKINVDEEPNTPTAYNIRALPTLLIFKNGQVVDQIVGAVSKDKIMNALNAHI